MPYPPLKLCQAFSARVDRVPRGDQTASDHRSRAATIASRGRQPVKGPERRPGGTARAGAPPGPRRAGDPSTRRRRAPPSRRGACWRCLHAQGTASPARRWSPTRSTAGAASRDRRPRPEASSAKVRVRPGNNAEHEQRRRDHGHRVERAAALAAGLRPRRAARAEPASSPAQAPRGVRPLAREQQGPARTPSATRPRSRSDSRVRYSSRPPGSVCAQASGLACRAPSRCSST